jgi:hypothetical protein
MTHKILFCLCALSLPLAADEGLWLFDQFPQETVQTKHQFEVTPALLDRLRGATVRIGSGSGAFVSSTGLILTNQHLVAGCLAQLSTPKADLLRDGYLADSPAAERSCPGLTAAVLLGGEDVTAKVKGTPREGETAAQAIERRRVAIARLEKECAPGADRCTVVTLFSGGRYDLYRYKQYRDLRLVFAPENDLAFFGRERDSLTYLRYGLDAAFVRAYENGAPARTPVFLKWSAEAIKAGDLVISAGNPAPSFRVVTAAQLTFYRDAALPFAISRLQSRIVALREFAAKSEANEAAVHDPLLDLLAAFKAAAGQLIGLKDDRVVGRKANFEGKIRRAVERDPKLGTDAGKVWDEVAKAYKEWTPNERVYQLLEGAPAPGSGLYRVARLIVRLAAERSKPEDQRLPEYRGELLAERERELDGTRLLPAEAEAAVLTLYLDELRKLSEKEAPVKQVAGNKNTRAIADTLAAGVARLADPAARRKLAAAPAAVKASTEPILRAALLLDEAARRIRKKREQAIESLEASAKERIAGYRRALFGAADYPDATGSPRVAYGVVKPYTDRAGVAMPASSSFGGLYYRARNEGPYSLPARWVEARAALDLAQPLDFVSTRDLGGGDPGSPVVNRAGELIGVTFDGNLESLPSQFLYSDDQARAVHVAAQGIVEALAKVYKAQRVLEELGAKPAPPVAPPPTPAEPESPPSQPASQQ